MGSLLLPGWVEDGDFAWLGCCFRLRKMAVLVLAGLGAVRCGAGWYSAAVANWENRGGGQAGSSISECLYL
jgi:hypothetical protein